MKHKLLSMFSFMLRHVFMLHLLLIERLKVYFDLLMLSMEFCSLTLVVSV